MGLGKKLKGLSEDEVKSKIKYIILTKGNDKILNSKVFKKYKYIKDILNESISELNSLFKDADKIDCPIKRYNYIKNNI